MTGTARNRTWDAVAATLASAMTAPAYAAERSALGAAGDWDAFRALPCSTKEAFRTDFRAFLTGAAPVRLHSTSGSTGQPAFVVYSAEEIESITVRAAETMRLAGARSDDTVLNLFGYGTFIAGNLYDWGASRLGALVIPFGSASMTPPTFAAQAIRAMAPTVINGVPSYLARYLAELRAAGEPNIDRVRILQCAGEVLTDRLRSRLAAVMPPRADIFDQYGMTEFGPLAAECPAHDGMHLLEHGLLFEVLDDDGNEVVEGDGELVVTSLENRAMALLRYRTGDRVELIPGRCSCGQPGRRIRVQRRTDDLTKIRGCLCSKQEIVDIVRSVAGVEQFRVLLYHDDAGVDRLLVEVAPGAYGRDAALVARIQTQLKDLLRIGARVEFVDGLEVPKTVSGKPRFLLDQRQLEEAQRKVG